MPLEPHKILAVVKDLATVRTSDNIATLAALAGTNSELRALCLPYLFAHVRWPHPDKHDEESGLHFFPESLWPLFKRFDLIWPDDWPDASPPRWGDRYYVGGDYHPRHTDKLATALPRMPSLVSFSICCPFFPPNSLFNALLTCTSVRELRMTDTPLYISMIPKSPPEFVIERLYLIPVAEAPRVGQSPYEARYSSPTLYHSREYRKKYKNDILARYAASAFLFDVGKPTSLTHVQVSGDLCTLDEFAQHDWPRLESLFMTGHPPRQTGTELVDVISKMPKLKELRLLFAKSVVRGDASFRVLPPAPEYTSTKGNHGSLLHQIESLAVSDACSLDRVGYFMKGVERLAILAISDIADPAVAFTKRTLQKILREASAAGTPAPKTIPPKPQPKHGKNAQPDPDPEPESTRPEIVHKNQALKHLRVMLVEKIEPEFCKFLAERFPKIEVLEVEKCGYHDGQDVAPWSAYVDNLKPIRRTLRCLRLGMQFEEQEPLHECTPHKAHICAPINDDIDHPTLTSPSSTTVSTLTSPILFTASQSTTSSIALSMTASISQTAPTALTPQWRLEREKCAHYFAKTLGQLTRVGFEYSKRPGPHRMDDRWLDWDIERRGYTPEMQKQWEVRREAKLLRLKEERNVKKEELRKRIEQEERELMERIRKEGENDARRARRAACGRSEGEDGGECEKGEVPGEGEGERVEESINRGAATVTRRTSVATTTSISTTSTTTTSTSIATPPLATTPSLTTPLSHPSSQQNLALAQQMAAAAAAAGGPFASTSTASPSFNPGYGSYHHQYSPPPLLPAGGYHTMSPEAHAGLIVSSPTSTTTPTYPPPNSHRISSSLSGGGPFVSYSNNTSAGGGGSQVSSISPGSTAGQQDYFMNFRASSTYTDYNTTTTPNSNPPSSSNPLTNPRYAMLAELDDVGEDESWDSDDEDPEGILGIHELRPSWYPFPECWRGRTLWEEEEIADAGGAGNSMSIEAVGDSLGGTADGGVARVNGTSVTAN